MFIYLFMYLLNTFLPGLSQVRLKAANVEMKACGICLLKRGSYSVQTAPHRIEGGTPFLLLSIAIGQNSSLHGKYILMRQIPEEISLCKHSLVLQTG